MLLANKWAGTHTYSLIIPSSTAEIVPPEMRGRLVALTDMFVNFGILLGYLIAWIVEVRRGRFVYALI